MRILRSNLNIMKDLKNTISSILGLLSALAVALLGVSGEVVLPKWLTVGCVIIIAVSTAFIGWAQGRNADLTRKSKSQITKQVIAKDGH